MTKPAIFTQGDVQKVLKGARAAGMELSRLEIDRAGRIVAVFKDGEPAEPENEWDEVLTHVPRVAAKRL